MTEGRKKFIYIILIIMLMTILSVIAYYGYEGSHYVSTEDAKVTGTLVKISPMSTGKIVDLFIDEGDTVQKDQIVSKLEVMNLQDKDIEQSVVRSPINGIIIKKSGTVGEVISAGQILAYATDPDQFYISANVEETKLHKLRLGQKVTIKVDQYKGKKITGYVKSIGNAANSVFSLLPSSSGANFTKVVQKIPVHIEFEVKHPELVNGTNAYVKIHLH
ncbi:MAG TPA: efflux RND transporter periplasmic adaptor subunit [Candidatus Cloacimonadota bacterium]|nr:efflux RND transporter periplasmic adaptor subunit [Candidatus Cloacimonadota bacterium]HPT72257.1 efflux RND transporter periplasmic adaptor subunit [Candidatus Cloacimonadota bacterium]